MTRPTAHPIRRPRLRTALKWTGTALCAALLVAWAASGWCYAGLAVSRGLNEGYFSLASGRFGAHWHRAITPHEGPSVRPSLTAAAINGAGPGWTWRPAWDLVGASGALRYVDLWLPLWIPFLFIALPTAVPWCRDWSRIRRGRCLGCGYDLRGLHPAPAITCPECGLVSRRRPRPPARHESMQPPTSSAGIVE